MKDYFESALQRTFLGMRATCFAVLHVARCMFLIRLEFTFPARRAPLLLVKCMKTNAWRMEKTRNINVKTICERKTRRS